MGNGNTKAASTNNKAAGTGGPSTATSQPGPSSESRSPPPLSVEPSEALLNGVPLVPISKIAKGTGGKLIKTKVLDNIDLARGDKGNPLNFEVDRSGKSYVHTLPDDGDASPDDVMQELLKGNMRFITGDSVHPHQDLERLQAIKKEQRPICAVLGCADSRVPTEIIFDLGFGDMFNCRVAGNVATTDLIASLEYAVLACNVKVVMVLGHTSCGAVKAALTGKQMPGYIDTLVEHLNMAIVRAQTNNARNFDELKELQATLRNSGGHPDPRLIDLVIRENVKYQMERVKRSTIILQSVVEGRVKLVGCVYNLTNGEVELIQE